MSGKISGDPDKVLDGTEKVAAAHGGVNYGIVLSTIATWFGSRTQSLVNKTINAALNSISNLTVAMFASGVVDIDGTLAANSDTRLATQKAVKSYVDAVAQGLDPKQSVLCASTANLTLSGEQTIDGISTVASRVLVKNQSAPAQNGIYVTSSGAWARAADADSWGELPGAYVFVERGTANADCGFVCTVDQGGTLGSTAVTFVQFAGAGSTLNQPTINQPTINQPNIAGVTDGSNANAGSVGEFKVAGTPNPAAAGTVTISIASPGVVTWVGHPYANNAGNWTSPLVLTTTGALPTGLTAGATVWVIGSSLVGNTFQVATSPANAIAGTAINTSGTQSGTHTATPGAPLTSGANANVAAINLPAGDWDISALVGFLPAGSTSITQIVGSWSTSSATLGGLGQLSVNTTPATVWGAQQGHVALPEFRANLAAPTTLYLVANSTFTVSTNVGFGIITARRRH